MNKRLQQFLAAENISQAQFAETIGVARASVSHILAGRNKPGFDFLESMVRHYPNLNFEWLLTGRGRMYDSAKSPSEAPAEPITPLSTPAEAGLFDTLQNRQPTAAATPLPAGNNYSDDLDSHIQDTISQRTISKVIVFYSDGSYKELP